MTTGTGLAGNGCSDQVAAIVIPGDPGNGATFCGSVLNPVSTQTASAAVRCKLLFTGNENSAF